MTVLDLEVTPGRCPYCDKPVDTRAGLPGRHRVFCTDADCQRLMRAAYARRKRALLLEKAGGVLYAVAVVPLWVAVLFRGC